MPTIVKPQVLVYQEFRIVPSEITDPLRAHISGPNALLHRHSVAAEKALINVGAYDPEVDDCYTWPQRQAGSLVDEDSVRLFIDNALLLYFQDLIGDDTGGRGTVAPVASRRNWIRSSSVEFKANGTEYPRSSLLLDRDVAVGDVVHLRGVTNPEDDCLEIELWTTVAGFAADEGVAVVDDARTDDDNQATVAGASTVTQTAGAVNCVTTTVDASDYDGYASGDIAETYTIEVVRSSIAGCNAARLRITSASGRDNVAEVQAAGMGEPTDIGTRGLKVTFDVSVNAGCSESADDAGVAADELVVGQTWEVEVVQDFTKACAISSGTYDGADDDIYIIEVTKGGLWADLPQVTCSTVKGLDFSGPTTITAEDTEFPVGSSGVGISFTGCVGPEDGSADAGASIAGLRKGDKFYITVNSGTNGPIRTLILRDDLPQEMWAVSDLDLELYIKKDIEVTENRLSSPPEVNYEIETTQLCVKSDITAYDATWTDNGVEQPLMVKGGTLYIEYREFLYDKTNEVGSISDVADIDEIPGQLDPDNPMKWGVYKALANSGGTAVKYTAVLNPADLDSWQNVIERADGRDDLYNFAPMTFDVEVLQLFKAHTLDESSPEAGNWKGMFGCLKARTSKMVVGQSTADAQLLHPTSLDGEVVMAILDDNPDASETQYTRLTVPARNAGFITYGVQPGDVVRYLYTIDAFGTQSYREFVVDQVLSESTLLLLDGHGQAVNQAQKIEIWHTLEKSEVVTDLKAQAQAFANRRCCMIWPDYVGSAGVTMEGYYLCAALAGLASGVVPQQGLTNVEIAGFDDFSRTVNFFSDSQIDELDDSGVWVCTVDRDGTPHSRHALTTDTLDVNHREEMVRRNVDSISYLFLRRLAPYIGRCNATPEMLGVLAVEIGEIITWLKSNGTVPTLGGQLIDGEIRELKIHPLAADRIYCVLDLTVPAPLNNIELHLVI